MFDNKKIYLTTKNYFLSLKNRKYGIIENIFFYHFDLFFEDYFRK